MKKKILMIVFLAGALLLASQGDALAKKKKVTVESDKDKISYIIGTDMARSLEIIKEEINVEQIILGIQDSLEGKELVVTAEESKDIMQAFSMKMQKKMAEQMRIDEEKNLNDGAIFLKENKEKEGVFTTDSDLQYVVMKEGDGPVPTASDKVTVHYRGTTIDGAEFDSSYSRGQPATFPVEGVIKGWTEALQLMKAGSKYKLFIPSDLAYGKRGSPPKIGPNSVLIFEVELINIEQ